MSERSSGWLLASGKNCFTAVPTAKIATCGWLIIAVNLVTPNMPKLLIVNVPAAVLAEHRFGALANGERVAYLTVSTGMGAGVYLQSGDTAVAYLAQVDHHIVDPIGQQCNCGQVGCLQTISGAQEIEKRYGRNPAEIENVLFWQDVANNLAVGMVNLSRISRVQAICVGGGIGFNNDYLRENLAQTVTKFSPDLPLNVLPSLLGEDGPIIGAKLLVEQNKKATIFH